MSGPLRLLLDGQVTTLRPTRLHEVLGLLLLQANTPVSIPEIASSIWPDARPADDEFIRPYMSRLRALLRECDAPITSVGHRYTVELDPARVDVLRFASLLTEADRATDPQRQRLLVDEALVACPTDAFLTDFNRTWAHVARTRHQRLWDGAALRRNKYWLRDGLHDQLLSVLLRQGVDRSTRQRWAEDYLLTLYRCGRINEAVAHYHALVRALTGANLPVPERLTSLAQAIQREDPSLDQADPRGIAAAADTLPPPRGPLYGRHAEIQAMRAHANTSVHDAVRVIGVYGPPGIGKTALAIAYAHAHKGRYPGGVLYADFSAFSVGAPVDPDAVLVSFLDALGVGANLLPPDRATRLDRFRNLVRRRPILMVYDNVARSQDVEELLPTAAGSLAIVTSRTRLTALTARFGALAVVIHELDDVSAINLLSKIIGARANDDEQALRSIARACAGHPLALSMAGARIATHPDEPVTSVAKALAEPGRRLPALDRDAESGSALADVFGWSYRSLDAHHALAFRLIGLSPCPSVDVPTAARLVGVDVLLARTILSGLASAHLLTTPHDGRYAMLDIVAVYAASLAADAPAGEARDALDRLYAYHLAMVNAAAERLWPTAAASVQAGDAFADAGAATAWLDEHRADLLAAALHDRGVERPEHIIAVAAGLFRYLDHGGYLDDATSLNAAAVAAARDLNDTVEVARSLNRLGAVLIRRGRLDDAQAALAEAASVYETAGDRRGQAIAIGNLGRVASRRGAHDEALTHQTQALELFRAIGDQIGEARTLTNLGIVREALDDLDMALRHHEDARRICEAEGVPDALARSVGSLAGLHRRRGDLVAATEHYDAALALFQTVGDRIGEATTLTNVGLVHEDRGEPLVAARLHEQAVRIFEAMDDRPNTLETLNNLATALLAAGRSTAAASRYHQAILVAEQVGDRAEAGRAHIGLVAAYARDADRLTGTARSTAVSLAHDHLRQARACYDEIDKAPPESWEGLAAKIPAD
jgi:tetratricopeptide (TPR) repeat protein